MNLPPALRRSWIAALVAIVLAGVAGRANPAPEDLR
jgi:hypothetical protein